MTRFRSQQIRGGWWVLDAYMQQWTPCVNAAEAEHLRAELEAAAAGGYDAIKRESLQWVRGTPYDPEVDHAALLPPDDPGSAPSDTDAIRKPYSGPLP